MALNGASHNIPGEKTGPVTDPPPPLSSEAKVAIHDSSSGDPIRQNEGGKDTSAAPVAPQPPTVGAVDGNGEGNTMKSDNKHKEDSGKAEN
jgi:valyl-tRNA synthetase